MIFAALIEKPQLKFTFDVKKTWKFPGMLSDENIN
jgi:hypothetical protein